MMKRNLIRITGSFLLCGLSLLAWGLDIGGALDNTTAGNALFTPAVNMSQSDKASLWLSHNFDENVSLSIKGNFKLALSNAFTPGVGINMTGDLDQLVFVLGMPDAFGDKTRLKLWAGRTSFADFSSEIINHKLDGISAEFSFPGLSWKLGVGTSALLFRHSAGLFNTAADLADTAAWASMYQASLSDPTKLDLAQVLCDPKIILVNTIGLPRAFLGQNLNIGLVGQVDLGANQAVAGNTAKAGDRIGVNAAYLGLGLDGKLFGSLYWNAYGWLEMGYTQSTVNSVYSPTLVVSNMDSLRFTIYLAEVANSVLDFGGKIGLGDYDSTGQFASTHTSTDLATMFTPLSFRGVANIFNPQMTNLIQADLGYSIKPFSANATAMADFQIELRGLTFMRLLANNSGRDAKTSETLVKGSSENYLGSEVNLNLSWRPLSDLGLSLNSGLFLPYSTVLDTTTRNLSGPWELKSTFTLSLSL